MNTYTYCITEEANECWVVSEGDCPSAPATGEYTSVEQAKSAVLAVFSAMTGGVDLDWEHGYDDDGFRYASTAWQVPA